MKTSGNIARTLTLVGGLVMCYLFGDIVEDFFFDDLDRWGGIWHNWSFFVQPFVIISLSYFLAHFYIHANDPKGARRHESGYQFSIEHSQIPLIWPGTHFTKHEDECWIIVLLSNAMYAYSTLYYAI